eukprot:GEMP01054404.1.p1 GENE.GEMP01054404.1~~GEMP01054404.1.p1  ORF type:complete len:239 (+),score=49.58 GEMP01054404.1:255-971(+)
MRLATSHDRADIINLFVSTYVEREPLCLSMNLEDDDFRPYATCIVDSSLRRSLLYVCEDHNGYLLSFACVVDGAGHREILDFVNRKTKSGTSGSENIYPVLSILQSFYSLLPQSFIDGRDTRVAYVHAVASVEIDLGFAKELLHFVHDDLPLHRCEGKEDSGFTHAVYRCSGPEMVDLTMNEFGAKRFGTVHPSEFQMPHPLLKEQTSRPFADKLRGDIMLNVVDLRRPNDCEKSALE